MSGPFGGGMNPKKVAMLMRDPSQLADMVTEEVPGLDASAAAILADIINVMRADVRRLAQVHDVDVEVQVMSEERAGELIAGITQGDGIELVQAFNAVAEKRNAVLLEALDEEEHAAFMEQKTGVMLTAEPETWDDEADEEE